MAEPAERMRMMRQRHRRKGLRELRLVVPDARSDVLRQRIAEQVAKLNPDAERDALLWIEAGGGFPRHDRPRSGNGSASPISGDGGQAGDDPS